MFRFLPLVSRFLAKPRTRRGKSGKAGTWLAAFCPISSLPAPRTPLPYLSVRLSRLLAVASNLGKCEVLVVAFSDYFRHTDTFYKSSYLKE